MAGKGIGLECNYIYEQSRVESFKGTHRTFRRFKYCTPLRFAAAGFFYAGTKDSPDNVKCFVCRKELSDWDKDDDPWEEHKKRGENCFYVKFKQMPCTTYRDFLELWFEMKKNIFVELQDGAYHQLKEDLESLRENVKELKKLRSRSY